jgi:hypothetical protein
VPRRRSGDARALSVELLVDNTGISAACGPLVESDLDAVRKTLDGNLVAAIGWPQETPPGSPARRSYLAPAPAHA